MEAIETPRNRRRWFQFRLSHLLAFVLLVCGILAWGRQRLEIIDLHQQVDRLERDLAIKTNRLKIQRILRNHGLSDDAYNHNLSDDEKMQELSSFIDIGDSLQHLESVIGEHNRWDAFGIPYAGCARYWPDLDLEVFFDANDIVDTIRYHRYGNREAQSVMLRSSGRINGPHPLTDSYSKPSSP